jgi:hypothetical protein
MPPNRYGAISAGLRRSAARNFGVTLRDRTLSQGRAPNPSVWHAERHQPGKGGWIQMTKSVPVARDAAGDSVGSEELSCDDIGDPGLPFGERPAPLDDE